MKWIFWYLLISACGILIAMRLNENVADELLGESPKESGVMFLVALIMWPLMLGAVLLSYVAWLIGKMIQKLFKGEE